MRKRQIEALENKLIFWDNKIQLHLSRLVAACNSRSEVRRSLDSVDESGIIKPNWHPADLVSPKPGDRITPRLVAAHDARRGPFKSDITALQDIQSYFAANMPDITKAEKHLIKVWLSENHYPLPQQQYRVPVTSSASDDLNVKLPTRQIRLKCIRNPDRWAAATSKDVVNAYINKVSAEV